MLTLLLSTLLACNGDTVDDTGDDGAVELDTFTIDLTLGWPEVGTGPLEGATVALDDGAGDRTEAVSDADGRVAFEVDWSLGPATVTIDPAYPGGMLHTFFDVTAEDDGMTVPFLDDSVLDEDYTISGTIEDRTDGTTLIVTTHGASGTMYQARTDSWDVEVLPELPFELLALEFTGNDIGVTQGLNQDFARWTLLSHEGVAADTEVDLVLTDELTPVTFSSTILLPADTDDPLYSTNTQPYAMVYSLVDGAHAQSCGWPTTIDIGPDGDAFPFEGEYVAPTIADSFATRYQAQRDDFTYVAWGMKPGTPETWDGPAQLLPIPQDVTLQGNDLGTWTFGASDPGLAGVELGIGLYDASYEAVWGTSGATPGAEWTLPAPPSSVVLDDLVGEVAHVLVSHVRYESEEDFDFSYGPFLAP